MIVNDAWCRWNRTLTVRFSGWKERFAADPDIPYDPVYTPDDVNADLKHDVGSFGIRIRASRTRLCSEAGPGRGDIGGSPLHQNQYRGRQACDTRCPVAGDR
jgi:hypothetical protein